MTDGKYSMKYGSRVVERWESLIEVNKIYYVVYVINIIKMVKHN